VQEFTRALKTAGYMDESFGERVMDWIESWVDEWMGR
jgi:hypothetical protein